MKTNATGRRHGAAAFGGVLLTLSPSMPASAADGSRVPPIVRDIVASPVGTSETLLEVSYQKTTDVGETLKVVAGNAFLTLRDDGKAPDKQARDGVFSIVVPVPYRQLVDQQETILKSLANLRGAGIPIFEGRELTNRRPLPAPATKERMTLRPDLRWVFVDRSRSLFITDPSVMGDPTRTYNPCLTTGKGNPDGVWSFKHLMEEMANRPLTGLDPDDMAFGALQSFTRARGTGEQMWRTRGGRHLLEDAPFALEAIVNRIDLAGNPSYGSTDKLPEGRFIFRRCDSALRHIILEYRVPRSSCSSLKSWAERWRHLGTLALGSPSYNAALAALTEEFVRRNAAPSMPNGSAIARIRTDFEVDRTSAAEFWNLSEMHLAPAPAGLVGATVAQTPLDAFDGTGDLAAWINLEQTAILAGTHEVPPMFVPFDPLRPFLSGNATSQTDRVGSPPVDVPRYWNAPGILVPEARHKFALATCNGCHLAETGTAFQHVAGTTLSGFLTGIDVPDPARPAVVHHFNDLAKRALALVDLADASCWWRASDSAAFPLPPLTFTPTLETH